MRKSLVIGKPTNEPEFTIVVDARKLSDYSEEFEICFDDPPRWWVPSDKLSALILGSLASSLVAMAKHLAGVEFHEKEKFEEVKKKFEKVTEMVDNIISYIRRECKEIIEIEWDKWEQRWERERAKKRRRKR